MNSAQQVIAKFFRLPRNRWPTVEVVGTRSDGVMELRLTFKASQHYCCCEPGCYLGLEDVKRCAALAVELANAGCKAHHVKVTGRIEAGTVFTSSAQEPVPEQYEYTAEYHL